MAGYKKDNIIDFKTRQTETREELLERLYNNHWLPLCSFVIARTGKSEGSEDIAQEVFIRLARLKDLEDKLVGNKARNRAYLFTIATNLILDKQKRKVIKYSYDDSLEESGKVQEITPEIIVSAQKELSIFKKVIRDMKPTWREAFILNRFKFMSYTEIAEHMDVTLKQVENYMAQALIKIRDAQRLIKSSKTESIKHRKSGKEYV